MKYHLNQMSAKLLLLSISLAFLIETSCGEGSHTTSTRVVVKSEPSTVVQNDTSSLITCPDGSTASVENGRDGSEGIGTVGESCTINPTDVGADITCSGQVVSIKNGESGMDGNSVTGTAGEDGVVGRAGTSCTVLANALGAEIACGDSSAQILNGVDGADGIAGTNGVDGVNGHDANSPVASPPTPPTQVSIPANTLYFYGFVCNNIPVIGTSSVRFLTYSNKVFILTNDYQTVWTEQGGKKYCKVKIDGVSFKQ